MISPNSSLKKIDRIARLKGFTIPGGKALAVFVLLGLAFGCGKEQEAPPSPQLQENVAQWRGGRLTLGECLHTFRELHTLEELSTRPIEEQLRQMANEWVSERIFWERSKAINLDRDPKYLEEARPLREDWSIRLILRREVDEKIRINRRDLERYYKEHSDRYRVPATYSYYKIFFSNQVHGKEVAEQRARECWSLLDRGANFHDLVSEYSDTRADRRLELNGPFRAGENQAEIEAVLMQTPIRRHSEVVMMPNGYFIFYPETKSEAVLKPFDQVSDQIAKELFAERRDAALNKYFEEIATLYRVEPNRELLDLATVKDEERILSISPGGTSYSWREFQSFARARNPRGKEDLANALEEFARRKLLLHHARHSGFDQSDYFRTRFRPVEVRLLADYLLRATIDAHVDPTGEEVEAFYNENSEMFRRPARMEVWHLVRLIRYPLSASERDIFSAQNEVYHQLLQIRHTIAEQGLSFATLAARFTEYEDGGYMGMVPLLAMPPEWVSVVATLEEGEISLPIKVKDTYELVMRGNYEEPGVLKYEAAREAAREKTREKMLAENRAKEIDRVLVENGLVMNLNPLADLMIRLADRSKRPPSYWLDPYR